ncbi:MAG: transcription elongation factor GreB [Cycloclasticus pugetii]|jgi:transcription elongation factor GreB|uniref:Transcription elongation factor GreB n=3 Tax=Cycloclasticus TaxID=34067 RepID=S5THZ2_9GAMM|nr:MULTISPECIES: transcription elongation factor GreB [Cycloclasticus]AFT66485.1 transcription elongation factor greb protein [Cycloclasticus sp. P1]AGS40512.1 Transcription elongation factor GreB [Cycloclasticus zancles 78-ME]ATI03941.1 transcription elongation factor GreB [Cycloclasticus sp. PY97N]EPD14379.1 transcription elongation factor greb protein [Cycloclasticus pugetii]MBV1898733.1 transcription elongation factor GreB [Cycloclasticus sp.]|tara:strand:+ start:190 stop:684 length:495 start_codon:yes stop_codon:yes gene_type:complete
MSRYRPPSPPKSAYITKKGFERLQAEEKDLWLKRRSVVAALSAAAAEGDRSENAEYIYRKKELREIDRRIRYLQKRLPILNVIHEKPSNLDSVFFSSIVTLEDLDGEEKTYRIVGPDELDHQPHYISMDSPVAKALFKKQLDDEVTVTTPAGKITYMITSIDYE